MYDDIRPYRDEEMDKVLGQLINDQEFQKAIANYSAPWLSKMFPNLIRWVTKQHLTKRARQFNNIHDLQQEAAKYIYRLIKRSTNGFEYSGIDKLHRNKSMLFISNHRDITLDPALVNLALHENDFSTLEIAIGDNLLKKPWISDLMRLNKSFIVKRGEKTKRGMLNAAKQLSAYIHHTLNQRHQHVWIAQREGRAKDGRDLTNTALISMLFLNKPKTISISEYLNQLNIIPVSISYEFDPCDQDKARELAELEHLGHYQKSQDEDLHSISRGILGNKGRIRLVFGETIQGEFADHKAVARAIDEKIIGNYTLFNSNYSAHQALCDTSTPVIKPLQQRMAQLNLQQQKWLLTMYANPVIAKQQQQQTSSTHSDPLDGNST